MGQAWIATLAGAGFAQPSLNSLVLVLVNDRMPAENGTRGMGASRFVGQYYDGKRAISAANVFHLKTAVTEDVSMEDYRAQTENAAAQAFGREWRRDAPATATRGSAFSGPQNLGGRERSQLRSQRAANKAK
jgi:hypothetical protein